MLADYFRYCISPPTPSSPFFQVNFFLTIVLAVFVFTFLYFYLDFFFPCPSHSLFIYHYTCFLAFLTHCIVSRDGTHLSLLHIVYFFVFPANFAIYFLQGLFTFALYIFHLFFSTCLCLSTSWFLVFTFSHLSYCCLLFCSHFLGRSVGYLAFLRICGPVFESCPEKLVVLSPICSGW